MELNTLRAQRQADWLRKNEARLRREFWAAKAEANGASPNIVHLRIVR